MCIVGAWRVDIRESTLGCRTGSGGTCSKFSLFIPSILLKERVPALDTHVRNGQNKVKDNAGMSLELQLLICS
uniref:Uncharacterized protein n=1 Tax=Octopus bimaculoides TaxID=37653 RepID=A0A0L8G7V5_OCTBM